VDNYVNQLENGQKHTTSNDRNTNKHTDGRDQQHKPPMFVIDFRTAEKKQEFIQERKFKIVERLAPSLSHDYQKRDLEKSINEIKDSYQQKIKELEEKQQEVWDEYFKEHHKVTSQQVIEIYKFVQRNIDQIHDSNIESNPELLHKSTEMINNIIMNNQTVENPPEEMIQSQPEYEAHHQHQHHYYQNYQNSHEQHYYQNYQEMYYSNSGGLASVVFQNDLQYFLHEVFTQKESIRQSRESAIYKVKQIIGQLEQVDSTEIYGSYVTNLDLPWSDIDFVTFSHSAGSTEWLDLVHSRFLDEKNSDDWIKKIDYISSATVPIIKMITEHSGVEVKVDLTYGDDSHRGKDWVDLVKDYMNQFPILSKMMMVIKQLLKVNNLNDPYSGGLSSYALTLMIVAFLQFHNMGYAKNLNLNYEVNLDDLGTTLLQFLSFYGGTMINFAMSSIHPWNPNEFTHNPIYPK